MNIQKDVMRLFPPRHCEEQRDEAIHAIGTKAGLLRFARNDAGIILPASRKLQNSSCCPDGAALQTPHLFRNDNHDGMGQ